MPKEDKLWRKLKKIEKKLNRRARMRRCRIRSTSSSSSERDEKELPSVDEIEANIITDVDNAGTQEINENGPMELDDTILSALGNPSSSEKTYGDDIHPEILKRIESILTDGVDKSVKEDLYKKYLCPKNFPLLEAPKLNLELEGLLSDPIKERDKKVEERQQQLGITLAAVLSVVDNLVKTNDNKKNIEILTDVSRLLSDLHYNDTCTRRKLIAINLDKNIVKSAESAKRDSFLFGEKFNDNIRSANAIKKAAPTILKKSNFIRKPISHKPSSYYVNNNKENFHAPPHSSRVKQGRGGRYHPRTMVRQHQPRTAAGKTHPHKAVRQS